MAWCKGMWQGPCMVKEHHPAGAAVSASCSLPGCKRDACGGRAGALRAGGAWRGCGSRVVGHSQAPLGQASAALGGCLWLVSRRAPSVVVPLARAATGPLLSQVFLAWWPFTSPCPLVFAFNLCMLGCRCTWDAFYSKVSASGRHIINVQHSCQQLHAC